MKTIHRALLFSAIPFLTSITASADPQAVPEAATNKVTDPKTDPRLGSAWRASEIIGTSVKNSTDETIGEVKDIIVDLKSGDILAVIVSSGGFLGIADVLSAVPSSALRYDTTAKAFKTKITKEQLQRAPQHKSNDWPDYSDATVMAKLREYSDTIQSDTNMPNPSNDIAKPEDITPTAMDQGTSESDIKITKDIRSEVVKQDGLSFNAKNIKIITKDGHVTLAGLVDSSEELHALVKIAGQHVNADNVTDSLKVK
jgi:hypothetical protein